MSVLLLIEHDHHTFQANTLALLQAASLLKQEVIAVVMGEVCLSVAEAVATLKGVDRVYYADDNCFAHFEPKACTALMCSLMEGVTHVLAPASTYGKALLPRIAACLDVAQVSDVMDILDAETVVHPIYAGHVMETVRHVDAIKLWTIRPTAFKAPVAEQASAPIVPLVFHRETSDWTFIKQEHIASTRPPLNRANVVVSGGRGLQSADHFHLIEALADCLGAAVGASRAAVDAGFISNDHQVGQTGQIVAPDLYIAIGISGAIQHLAGMKESKVIVAINKDPDAPIFQIATYGLVGDLFEIIPQWIAKGEKLC